MSTLSSIMPEIEAAMTGLNVLLEAGDRAGALQGLNEVTNRAVRLHRPDIEVACHFLPARTVSLSICRIPATPRPGRPIAIFLPGLGASLLLAAVHALALAEHFDVVVCSLPGHSGSEESSDVSLGGFADEFAALIASALPRARNLFVIGQSIGGLIALELARRCPDQIRDVVLLDPPFRLTRERPAKVLRQIWMFTGCQPYQGRICQEIMGFDPVSGAVLPPRDYHALVRGPFNCLLLAGSSPPGRIPSFVEEEDIAAVRAINPAILVGARTHAGGHTMLADDPRGVIAELTRFLRPEAAAV
ncbi:MAG TPA: alpha/beta fold hydrolase [Acetobacteraceae bacterium]|jgi:pimeloyl-ACP methyl ester carboxylesterase